MPFAATWMQLEIIILNEVSQKEKDKYQMISHMWNLKYGTTNISTKQKQTHRRRDKTGGCQGGRCWGRDGVGGWGQQM